MTKEKQSFLKIKNGNLGFIYSLLDFPKHGKEARAKNRFINIILPRMQEIRKERTALLEQYAKKDKEGKAMLTEDKKSYDIVPEDFLKYEKEHRDYLDEDFIIDITSSNKETLRETKKLIQETPKELTTREGVFFDLILTEFENAGL